MARSPVDTNLVYGSDFFFPVRPAAKDRFWELTIHGHSGDPTSMIKLNVPLWNPASSDFQFHPPVDKMVWICVQTTRTVVKIDRSCLYASETYFMNGNEGITFEGICSPNE